MSQYFSRLAERSEVTTTAPAVQANSEGTNGLSDWHEQATEVTASVSSPAHENPDVHKSQSDHSTHDISANRPSRVLSSIASTTEQGIQPGVSAIIPGRTESSDVASELNVDLDSNSYSSDNVSRSTPKTESTVNDSSVSDSVSVSEYVDDNLIKAHDAKSNTDSSEKLDRSRVMPTRLQSDQSERVERVSSSPARAPSVAVIPAHSSSKSSVQVNIGKIELEIHAPAVAANRAPQPIKTIVAPAPAESRSSVFNPHRHYLRSR